MLVGPGHAVGDGRVLEAEDPLAALQALAVAWRRELGAQVIGVTGSTGKTSTKDLLAAMVATGRRVTATAQNLNTEIGLPLTILGAPEGTEVLVLEMAMRGAGQIAELVAIAEPDVGLITNIGPVHLEQLGTLEAIAAEKAGVIDGLRPGGTAVVPAGEPLLAPHLRVDVRTVTFGPGGDVDDLGGVELPFTSAHMTPQRHGRAGRRACRRGRAARPDRRPPERSAGPADRASGARWSSWMTATTPTRCRCEPHWTSSPRPRAGAASRCSATCSSSGPARAASTRRSASTPATAASTSS